MAAQKAWGDACAEKCRRCAGPHEEDVLPSVAQEPRRSLSKDPSRLKQLLKEERWGRLGSGSSAWASYVLQHAVENVAARHNRVPSKTQNLK
jgi:hypothetical protein